MHIRAGIFRQNNVRHSKHIGHQKGISLKKIQVTKKINIDFNDFQL